ncbi:MAG: glycosyltransferase family 39 protein [Phototrophicaceae bacterium]
MIHLNTHNRPKILPLLLTTFLLLFGFMILVIGIDAMHMRPDEELTFRNMSLSFTNSIVRLAQRNNQAPLWWIQIWTWQRLVGLSEFAGRINSILWGLLTLSLIYQIGYSWFGQRRYGWFAMAILSVNAYFFIYALEIRMYTLGMFVVTLSMRFFFAWLQNRSWQLAIMYGLSASLLLYTHYYFAFIILSQVIYFIVFHLFDWRMVKQGFIVAGTALFVWLPGIVILYMQLQFIDFSDAGGLKIPTKPTNLISFLELAQLSSNGLWQLYTLIIVVGIILLWRKKAFWLIWIWLIISPSLVFILNLYLTVYNVRYTSFMIPAIGLIIGIILASLPTRRQHVINWLALIIVCGISLYQLPNYIPVRIPFRHIFTDVTDNHQDNDGVFIIPLVSDLYLEDQYERYLPETLLNNRIFNLSDAQSYRRIWFLTNQLFSEESETDFETLEATHRVFYVADQSDCSREYCYVAQLMVAPPMDNLVLFGDRLEFLGADVNPIIDNQLPILLWWSIEETISEDYSISLQLLDSNGSLVTQSDHQIRPLYDIDEEIPTSQMQTDGNYIDWRLLDLPSDLPSGDYYLQLIVYQWWDGVRLITDDNLDSFAISTIKIE